ncbi:MAG: hypothetical protein ACI9AF_001136, partial [Granulosicoccus sp.]
RKQGQIFHHSFSTVGRTEISRDKVYFLVGAKVAIGVKAMALCQNNVKCRTYQGTSYSAFAASLALAIRMSIFMSPVIVIFAFIPGWISISPDIFIFISPVNL